MVPYDDGDWVNVLFACKLERELAEAKDELEQNYQTLRKWAIDNEKLESQLTAHKAALEKCEKALIAIDAGCYLRGTAEALAAIKQLKQQ